MAGSARQDRTWSPGHMASTNRNPVDVKRGSIRKINAEAVVLSGQSYGSRLPVAQRSRRRSSCGLRENLLRIGRKGPSWDIVAPERINAFRIRQPFVVKEPADEVGRIGTEQRHPIAWHVEAMIGVCCSVSCAASKFFRRLDHIDGKGLLT